MRASGLLLLVLALAACTRPAPPAELPPTRPEIWAAIQPLAARYRIAPGFIYALVAAESDFNPRARNGQARGLLCFVFPTMIVAASCVCIFNVAFYHCLCGPNQYPSFEM